MRTGKRKPRTLTYPVAVNREIAKAYRHAEATKAHGTDTTYRIVERVRWSSLKARKT